MKLNTSDKVAIVVLIVMWIALIYFFVSLTIQEQKYQNLEELRPCPFCGGTNIVYDASEYDVMKEGVPDVERVICKDCNLDMWAHPWHEDIGAKEKWNRRK